MNSKHNPNIEPSSTYFHKKAFRQKNYVLLKERPNDIANEFRWAPFIPEISRATFCNDLSDAFWWSFGTPAPVKAGYAMGYELERVSNALNRFVRVYAALDAQGKAAVEATAMACSTDCNIDVADIMERLTVLNQSFSDHLDLRRDLQVDPRQGGGPETDYRVRSIISRLADIFEEHFEAITMSASADGTYKGRFVTFCRDACQHFLGNNAVSDATLVRAVHEEHAGRVSFVRV